jgi:hypothetical protein
MCNEDEHHYRCGHVGDLPTITQKCSFFIANVGIAHNFCFMDEGARILGQMAITANNQSCLAQTVTVQVFHAQRCSACTRRWQQITDDTRR